MWLAVAWNILKALLCRKYEGLWVVPGGSVSPSWDLTLESNLKSRKFDKIASGVVG